MERLERLKWIKLSQEINKGGGGEYRCPRDNRHVLNYEIKDFPAYGKREIHLTCKECNVHLTFTLDIPDKIDEGED